MPRAATRFGGSLHSCPSIRAFRTKSVCGRTKTVVQQDHTSPRSSSCAIRSRDATSSRPFRPPGANAPGRCRPQALDNASMAKRSYGTGSLFIKGDKWYGRWWVGAQRVKRLLGPVRRPGSTDGLTRTQAERELRRRIEDDAMVVRSHSRRTLADAGARYVDHLEHVMERKRTTIQNYRGYLSGHLV